MKPFSSIGLYWMKEQEKKDEEVREMYKYLSIIC